MAQAVASADVSWSGAGVAGWQFASDAKQSGAWSLAMAPALGLSVSPGAVDGGGGGDTTVQVVLVAAGIVAVVIVCAAVGYGSKGRAGRCPCLPSKPKEGSQPRADVHIHYKEPSPSECRHQDRKGEGPQQPFNAPGVRQFDMGRREFRDVPSQPFMAPGAHNYEIGAPRHTAAADQPFLATGVKEGGVGSTVPHVSHQPYLGHALHPDEVSAPRHTVAAAQPFVGTVVNSERQRRHSTADVDGAGLHESVQKPAGASGRLIEGLSLLASPMSVVSPVSGTSDEVVTAVDAGLGVSRGRGGLPRRRGLLEPMRMPASQAAGGLPGAIRTPILTPVVLLPTPAPAPSEEEP